MSEKDSREELKQLLRAQDVAKVLNISLALAYRLIQQGELQSVRIGGSVRVRSEDLQEFIERSLTSSLH